MSGDFCRMCGSKKLRKQRRDVFLHSQRKTIKAIEVWICANCGEEFLDDGSRTKLYQASRTAHRQRSMAA